MKLIVGLGNPGKKYQKTRHNSGFIVLDGIAKKLNINIEKEKFSSLIAKTKIKEEQVILMKPLTYMNDSGRAVIEVVKYYDIQKEDILIIHDDMDMVTGALRIKKEGKSGGQKGMQSIIDALGSNEIARIKIGVGHSEIGNHDVVPDWVLSKVPKEEKEIYDKAINNAIDGAIAWVNEDIEKVMSKYNIRIKKEKEDKE